MFSNSSPLQDRRGAAKSLGLSVQPASTMNAAAPNSLPPLKSPRGHLLDRIRSTPRSSKFVPQGAQTANAAAPDRVVDSSIHGQTQYSTRCAGGGAPTHQRQSSASTPSRSANLYTPQRHAYSNSIQTVASHDLAKSDQLAILEQQLRSQNDLLAQQQLLLQKLQYQQQAVSCPTPPYTPEARGNPAQNSIVYDPATGQYYMYAPQYSPQPQFQYTVTPAQQEMQKPVMTPDSYTRATKTSDDRSPSSPKDGASSRQPKGPPAVELLIADKHGTINFATRQRSKVQRASIRPAKSTSPLSQRRNYSLGSIEEAFPAISL